MCSEITGKSNFICLQVKAELSGYGEKEWFDPKEEGKESTYFSGYLNSYFAFLSSGKSSTLNSPAGLNPFFPYWMAKAWLEIQKKKWICLNNAYLPVQNTDNSPL